MENCAAPILAILAPKPPLWTSGLFSKAFQARALKRGSPPGSRLQAPDYPSMQQIISSTQLRKVNVKPNRAAQRRLPQTSSTSRSPLPAGPWVRHSLLSRKRGARFAKMGKNHGHIVKGITGRPGAYTACIAGLLLARSRRQGG